MECEFKTDVGGCLLAGNISKGFKTITNFKCKYNDCYFKQLEKAQERLDGIATLVLNHCSACEEFEEVKKDCTYCNYNYLKKHLGVK